MRSRRSTVTLSLALAFVGGYGFQESAPSADDKAVTRQLVASGKVLDMPVYDHVIIGADKYFSFAESGSLDVTP